MNIQTSIPHEAKNKGSECGRKVIPTLSYDNVLYFVGNFNEAHISVSYSSNIMARKAPVENILPYLSFHFVSTYFFGTGRYLAAMCLDLSE